MIGGEGRRENLKREKTRLCCMHCMFKEGLENVFAASTNWVACITSKKILAIGIMVICISRECIFFSTLSKFYLTLPTN